MMKKWFIWSVLIILSIFVVAFSGVKIGILDYFSLKDKKALEQLVQYEGEEIIYDGICFKLEEYLYDKETGCGYCHITAQNQDGTKLTKQYFDGKDEKYYSFEIRASCSFELDYEETEEGISFYLEFYGAEGWVEAGEKDSVCLFECHNPSETLGKFVLEDCTKEKKKIDVEGVQVTVTPIAIKMKRDIKTEDQIILKYQNGEKQYLVKKGKYVGMKGGTTMRGDAGIVYGLKNGCDISQLESIIIDGKEYSVEK